MSQRPLRQFYTTIYTGINSKVNCYGIRSFSLNAGEKITLAFVFRDGSFYYANADGSTYWNNGKGKSRFI
ncbi:hypothetical protein BU23DRAFT_552532 [Bimuria novae-zelandiae CBS 107.79]|uniref:Uncharacterized protein n=1 Tax=Bimuria novae-zelandiae CBS 107.79 TaxID=1447943 RepID=A0A6A5VKS5_9PLEO|nr:hypothetical protein BU23DRAFT_552532 [Bimuria novae-zelandiae CBS 107.79]